MSTAEKIQAILNTLGLIEIPATESNVSILMGLYQALKEVKAEVMTDEAGDE